jgi:3-phenylpropionate/trans-cinnamate dioxygenase ferredoxin reductase subunit
MAGAKAAEALREGGFDGRIVLIGIEPEPPYERPPLSKDYLRRESPREKTHVLPASWYAEHDVELLTETTVTAVHPEYHAVTLEGDRRLAYDRLLLATGAIPRRLPLPGADLPGVHLLRSIADSDALHAALAAGGRVVIVGAGWIGCEVAASARQLGAEVVLVEPWPVPLARVLGRELGGWFAELHRRHGVELMMESGVEAFEGDDRVRRVRLTDGRTVAADAVVIGVGVEPDTQLAAAAGLKVEDGIVVDEHLRTSAPDIFAAGDVAGAFNPRYGRHVRVEHWSNALNQGAAAGRSMLGTGEAYDRLPYFFTDQYDAGMEYTGLHAPDDRLVVRGSLEADAFQAFWLDAAGRVTAGMHVNDWDAIEPIRRLVGSGVVADPAALADPAVPVAPEAATDAPSA